MTTDAKALEAVHTALDDTFRWFTEHRETKPGTDAHRVLLSTIKARRKLEPTPEVRTEDDGYIAARMDNRELVFTASERALDDLRELAESDPDKLDIDRTFLDMIEFHRCNGFVEEVMPHEVGALTDSILLADSWDLVYDDQHNLLYHGRIYWFPSYMTESPCRVLLDTGEVAFRQGVELQ